MRVLVCGGREYLNRKKVWEILDQLNDDSTFIYGCPGAIHLLITGGASGADTLAEEWAVENGVAIKTFKADWVKNKRSAGPIRNAQMIVEGKPDLVVVFPGGRGTEDMMNKAISANIDTFVVGRTSDDFLAE